MELHFYEKPGCINNTKQKEMLAGKGYPLISHNILEEPWKKEILYAFLKDRPIAEWFNTSAPRIKSGEVSIDEFNEDAAIEAMINDPYLIKRPLIRYGEKYGCGFDSALATDLINGVNVDSLLQCPRLANESTCNDSPRQ